MNNEIQIQLAILATLISIAVLLVFVLNYAYAQDENAACTKWVGIVELAKQDYPHFLNETLMMAEKKCGFDVSNIIP